LWLYVVLDLDINEQGGDRWFVYIQAMMINVWAKMSVVTQSLGGAIEVVTNSHCVCALWLVVHRAKIKASNRKTDSTIPTRPEACSHHASTWLYIFNYVQMDFITWLTL
jgi:hypothetical protein